MALRGRTMIDPRWPFYGRLSFRTAMFAQVKAWNLTTPSGKPTWDPYATDPADRVPGTPNEGVLVYEGRARIAPNKDWRARRMEWDGQNVVDFAVRVQLSFMDNKVPPPADWPVGVPWFPRFEPQDLIAVQSVLTSEQGVPVDYQLPAFDYRIRNSSSSSNSMVATLLCDINVVNQSGPHGY